MKHAILIIIVFYCASSLAQVEDQPISQKQFKAHQIKQKKATNKRPPKILPSLTYITTGKTYIKKKFRVKVIGDGVVNLKALKIGGCSFHYVAQGNTGFSDAGSGTYYLTVASGKVCGDVQNITGSDISSVDLIVEYTQTLEFVTGAGGVMKAPSFEVIKRY